jgi:hypothetical protein
MTNTAKRPQCLKLCASYYVESSYGVAFNNSAITKLFNPNEPALFELSQTREDDSSTIKGHEFAIDPDADVITAQDAASTINFRAYLNVLGWLCSLITGTDTVVASAPNYTHTFKIQDACVNDQAPSTNLVTMFTGDTASYYKWTGACLNEFKLTVDKAGVANVSAQFQTDGKVTVVNTFSVPATITSADPIAGVNADFLMGPYGGALVSKKSAFMGADFTINNGLDVADGRANIAANTIYLGSLRLGNRAVTFNVKMNSHQGDEYWQAYIAKTKLDIQLTLTISATRSIDIRIKKATIGSIKPSFSGIRDTSEITFKAYYEAAESSPWVITIINGDSAYLVPITAGM